MNSNNVFILAANAFMFAMQGADAGSLIQAGDDRGMPAPKKVTTADDDRGMLAPKGDSVIYVNQFNSEQDCRDSKNPTRLTLPKPNNHKPVGCLDLPEIVASISLGCPSGSKGVLQIWEYWGPSCDKKNLEGTNDWGNDGCLKLTYDGDLWFSFDYEKDTVCQQGTEESSDSWEVVPTPPPTGPWNAPPPTESGDLVLATPQPENNDADHLLGGFRCAGGNIKLYSFYEKYAKTSGGTACIGGSGGSAFYLHKKQTTVKVLRVWWGHGSPNDGFKAIQVEYFNGQIQSTGSRPSSDADAKFTFSAGEFIDGSITLGGNGVGSRTGYLGFTTNKGRTFKAGKLHTPYYFQASGTLLAGFFGGSGNDIDHLGIYLFKEVSKIEISGVNYPTLDSYLAGLTPTSIVDRPYCNNTPANQSEIRTVTVATGSSETWGLSTTTSFDMTVSISVSAGVPEIFTAQTSTQYKWGISVTGSYKMTQDTKNTVEQTFSFIYPAYTIGRHHITQFDSAIDVPWEGKEKITFKDGTSMTIDVNGQYDGVYVSSIKHVYDSEPCNPCVCDDLEEEALTFENLGE